MLTRIEVEELRDEVYEHQNSAFPNMTYEQGIADALDVVLENTDLDEFKEDLPEYDPEG